MCGLSALITLHVSGILGVDHREVQRDLVVAARGTHSVDPGLDVGYLARIHPKGNVGPDGLAARRTVSLESEVDDA